MTLAAANQTAPSQSPEPLPPLDHVGRIAAVRNSLAVHEVDVVVVTRLVNVRYLSGFSGSHGVLVIAAQASPTLVTDGRYRDQAAAELQQAGIEVALRVESVDFNAALTEVVHAAGSERADTSQGLRIGLEAEEVSWAEQRRYAERFPAGQLVALTNVVEGLRARKDPGEIARMELAAHIADQALADTVALLHDEPTEAGFALALEVAMRRLGADGPSFETIVASGPNGALPHARPGPRRIQRGDLVVLDFGALVAGYHSDMTRTVCVGPASSDQRRHFDVVRRAQADARDAVRAGVATKHIDAVARRIIEEAGWAEQFSHGTGHGIGLEVHEAPLLSRTTPGLLEVDFVVTVEPGVYKPGQGGVRIEDTVVVSETGCRSLTRFPKELEV